MSEELRFAQEQAAVATGLLPVTPLFKAKVNLANGVAFNSPWYDVSQFPKVSFSFGLGVPSIQTFQNHPALLTVEWAADSAGALLMGQRQLVVSPLNIMDFTPANLGPFMRFHYMTNFATGGATPDPIAAIQVAAAPANKPEFSTNASAGIATSLGYADGLLFKGQTPAAPYVPGFNTLNLGQANECLGNWIGPAQIEISSVPPSAFPFQVYVERLDASGAGAGLVASAVYSTNIGVYPMHWPILLEAFTYHMVVWNGTGGNISFNVYVNADTRG